MPPVKARTREHISIHALREEGDSYMCYTITIEKISIHALREEGDFPRRFDSRYTFKFLSTPSARRATITLDNLVSYPTIFLSTPSARRATPLRPSMSASYRDFYPRPPRGGRQRYSDTGYTNYEFLSTPSARRATCSSGYADFIRIRFLSTPSARRATINAGTFVKLPDDFYPRPPRGGRPIRRH